MQISQVVFRILTHDAEAIISGGKLAAENCGKVGVHGVVWLVVVVALLASMWETYPAGSWPSIK